MEDNITALAAVILACFLCFFLPAAFNAGMNDSTAGIYVIQKTETFGNRVCENGYLTAEMYERFLKELANTNCIFDIEIVREHMEEYPVYSSSGAFTGKVRRVGSKSYKKEILGQMYADAGKTYYFNQGDYFSIQVSARNRTLAQKLFQAVGIQDTGKIIGIGGGVVRDENY